MLLFSSVQEFLAMLDYLRLGESFCAEFMYRESNCMKDFHGCEKLYSEDERERLNVRSN